MIVRQANISDKNTIAEFQVLMAHETENIQLDQKIVMAGVSAVFNDPSKGKYYIAEEDEMVVASVLTTYEWSDWRNGTIIWLQSVYVLPEFRKKGIFKALYNYIQNQSLSDNNIKGIRLYVEKKNIPAQAVYEKLGMDAEHYQLYEWLND